jgi:hypothetical protein
VRERQSLEVVPVRRPDFGANAFQTLRDPHQIAGTHFLLMTQSMTQLRRINGDPMHGQ